MRRFNTIIESANPPGINQLWIDKKKLRYFTEGKWHILGGGGSSGGSIVEIGPNGNWFIDGEDTRRPSRGEPGPQGENGKDGKDGTDGITPHIGNNKHWFIGTVDTGIIAEGTKGADGLNGKDGIDGINGTSAGFGEPVATAESISNNAPAEVTIEASGPDTAKVFTFHFKIPKGKDGSGGGGGTGVDGKTPILQIGNVTTVSAGGNASANVRYTSDDPDDNPIYAIDLGIPRGVQGTKGDTGEAGTDGVDGQDGKTPVFNTGNVSTGAAGSNVIVAITSNGVDASGNPKYNIDFTIPRGDKGADGTNGSTPVIGANGNWFINDVDTTRPSRGEKGEAGTTDYTALTNKPSIAGVELSGNKTLNELGIQEAGDYATELYVTESIAAAIGNINSTLDTINGEVI